MEANAESSPSTSAETSAAAQGTAASIEEVASSTNQFAATVERLNNRAQGMVSLPQQSRLPLQRKTSVLLPLGSPKW